jgi:arginyl-tRNA synthetase
VVKENSLIAKIESVSGYVNFRLNYSLAGTQILEGAVRQNATFGIEKAEQPIRITVEHTSANPSGPLTMGHARNAVLGDVLARMLKARGHSVNRRFYIDDVGRQVSILAYGYRLLGEPEPQGKADYWLGRLYACVNCAVQIEATKAKLKQIELVSTDPEKRAELQRTLDEWVGIAEELQVTDNDLLTRVVKAVQVDGDPEKAVQEIGRKYEQNDKQTVALVRKVAELSLSGIKASLARWTSRSTLGTGRVSYFGMGTSRKRLRG